MGRARDLVATAAALANTVASDPVNHVLTGYSRFRRYTPRMLRTLNIEAAPVAKPLLEAAAAHPTRPPPVGGGRVVLPARRVPRRRALAGARSRRYGDIRKTLLSAPAVVDADPSLPVPASPQDWLVERKVALP